MCSDTGDFSEYYQNKYIEEHVWLSASFYLFVPSMANYQIDIQ